MTVIDISEVMPVVWVAVNTDISKAQIGPVGTSAADIQDKRPLISSAACQITLTCHSGPSGGQRGVSVAHLHRSVLPCLMSTAEAGSKTKLLEV